jgi:tetratricopeptide (TPR) repeat protein
MRIPRRLVRTVQGLSCAAALLVGGSLALKADVGGDADLQLQLGSLLYDETRYQEALVAFTEATKSDDARVAVAGRKGTVRTALKVAEFTRARQEAEELVKLAADDPEARTLHADALWSAGLFDEAEVEYRAGVDKNPGSARARFGLARSLAAGRRGGEPGLGRRLHRAQGARGQGSQLDCDRPWQGSFRRLPSVWATGTVVRP